MTVRAFKCPFCGYKFRTNPERIYQRSAGDVIRGKKESQPPRPQRQPSVDLKCPNCHEEFEVEVEV
jgi:DNA-directed RNA polymerase subunit M/transcription elongation factor TFIIS